MKKVDENYRQTLISDKQILIDKGIKIKNDLLKLIGEDDYRYIMSLYSSIDTNLANVDEIYKKIEDFATQRYEKFPEIKEKFDVFYLLLVSSDCLADKKEQQLKKILMM